MDFQEHLDSIILSGKNKEEILHLLSVFLEWEKNLFFCDFDDTFITPGISTESYYHGYHTINRLGFNRYPFIPPRISLSSVFLDHLPVNTWLIVILTRNFGPFVKNLVKNLEKDLAQKNLKVVGVVGKVYGTCLSSFTSYDKLSILPSSAIFMTDIFEYSSLKDDKRCIFLPPPFYGPRCLVQGIHWCIKVRDYFRGVMSCFLGK